MNITLIGMPGSGKSFIGKKLASRLGYQLIELDALLEQEYNRPLQTILDDLGEEMFLRKQADDVIVNIQNQNNLIVSPGGSIVYSDDAMEYLKKVSTVVYLQVPLGTIKSRIKEVPRGIVGLKDKTLEELYEERSVLYEKYAAYIIDGDQDAEKIIDDIMAHQ